MRYELLIDGMLAVHAKHALFTALAMVDGVRHADVELGKAIVEFGERNAAAEAQLRNAVELSGFTLRSIKQLPTSLPLL